MSEDLGPGHAVLAIPDDTRTYWIWPVNYKLNWRQAVVVGPAEKDSHWIVRHDGGSEAVLHREAFMRVSFHVYALGQQGQRLMDTGMFSDMGMYASARTAEGADEIAMDFFDDPRVAAASVDQYLQEAPGSVWKFHRHLKTIER